MEPAGQPYDPGAIEARWRQRWAESDLYHTPDAAGEDGVRQAKFYCLDFFPYPSGYGLSVGHGRNYVPTDVVARYHRMHGDAVLHPMGWDAFGLPAENEAIKRGVHPAETTARYAQNYRRQMTLLGCSYDWGREINSSSPEYYRWTQWFFLLLYRRGLAYRAAGQQWWCPGCKTVLANEQVNADGACWRGHSGVYKRDLEQWYFRSTAYADRLLADLDTLDWPAHVAAMQRQWIGRSAGVEFVMAIAGAEPAGTAAGTHGSGPDVSLTVYTTRPDTIFGMAFVALAPEHPLVDLVTVPERRASVHAYREQAGRRSDVARQAQTRHGGREEQAAQTEDEPFTGAYAVNPVNGEPVPVYVADYVLMGHGSGAIMGVPAHDARDFEFACRHRIPLKVVVTPPAWDGAPLDAAYTGPGTMVGSGPWNGLPSEEAAEGIVDWLAAQGRGRRAVQYRLHDWLISRQRYWGAPIPIVYCARCGTVPVPESALPVRLPAIETWLPGDDGRSPLANVPEFVETTCPTCGGPARRETDTMDGFACSSWYYLRFVSPGYGTGPFDPAQLAHWGTPDLYVGGAEQAVQHLLYARFWTKVMYDAGLVPFNEPFPRLRSQGQLHVADPVTGETRRMAKSAGNVVTPDSMAERYGADALRLHLLFMAPFENKAVWDEDGVKGARRFLERTWRLATGSDEPADQAALRPGSLARSLHRTIRRVSEDIESLQLNTAVAGLMEFLNELVAYQQTHGRTAELAEAIRSYVLLLAPFAPFTAEELWARLGGAYSVHGQPWPAWDARLAAAETVTLVVQVDGRVRDKLEVAEGIGEAEACCLAQESEAVRRALGRRGVARVVYVPGRLVNIVTA